MFYAYQPSQCYILSKGMQAWNRLQIPLIQVNNAVDNKLYQAWVPVSHIHPTTDSTASAQALLSPFQANTVIPCWYDPVDPSKVILDKNYHWSSWLITIGFLVIAAFLSVAFAANRPGSAKRVIDPNYPEGLEIKENRFTKEYIYHGEKPFTPDMLPAKFQRLPEYARVHMAQLIDKNGRLVTLNRTYALLATYILLVVAIIILVQLYL